MTHTYHISGMTCEGCVAKVRHRLLMNPDITGAEVSLERASAVITMQRHLSVDQLQSTIGLDAKYRLSAKGHQQPARVNATASWLSTYKPLLLIGVFLTMVSILTSRWDPRVGMNHFMAGFFLVFSFFKMLDLPAFVSSYSMYDVVAMRVRAWGYAYPFVELVLGVAYLTGFNVVLTNWATIIVMGVSSVGVVRSVASGQKIQCACLGAVFNLPMSTVTIIEDLLMVVMAAFALTQVH